MFEKSCIVFIICYLRLNYEQKKLTYIYVTQQKPHYFCFINYKTARENNWQILSEGNNTCDFLLLALR